MTLSFSKPHRAEAAPACPEKSRERGPSPGRGLFCLGMVAAALAWLAGQTPGVSGGSTMNQCEAKTYTLTLANDSGNPLTDLVLGGDLAGLTGFSYVTGSTSIRVNSNPAFCTANPTIGGTTFTWDLDTLCGTVLTLNDGDTLHLSFQLQTDCGAASGTLNCHFDYAVSGTPGLADEAFSIQVLPGAMSVRKTPALIPQEIGENVTWTIAVENTGLGTVRNVLVTDLLGAGLEYVSSSPAGVNSGQTTTWSAAQVPGLAEMVPGAVITFDLTARLVACAGLENTADARWGCDLVSDCFNTAAGGGTATATAQRLARTPLLEFTPPEIGFNYCADSEIVAFTIANSGDGPAEEVWIGVDFGSLAVSGVSAGAVYNAAEHRFELQDPIPAGGAYNLGFSLSCSAWCGGAFPEGDLLWQPRYEGECGEAYLAPVQLSTISIASGMTSLDLTQTGGGEAIQIGQQVSYQITSAYNGPLNCGSGGSVSTITVMDDVPAGFSVLDAGGGTWVPGGGGTGGTITWTYQPPAYLNTNITLQSPDLTQCEIYCFTTFTNTVSASGSDCCGCTLNASAAQATAIECEEFVDSNKTATPVIQERCGTIEYTNTYNFGSAGITLNALTFMEYAEHQQQFIPGSLTVTYDGADITACVLVTDATPGGNLSLDFSGCAAALVNNKNLTIAYRLTITEATVAACGSTAFYSWSGLRMGSVGSGCLQDGEIMETVAVSVQSPAMAVSLAGLGSITDRCQTQTVTLTLTQTSDVADPRDVRLVLSGSNYYLVNPAATNCAGSVSPTACTPSVVGNDYVWYFGDGFNGAGQSCILQFEAQKRCAGGGELTAIAYFDDRCRDDGSYDDTCATSATATPLAIRSGELQVEVTPEVYQATTSSLQWKVFVTNRGAGSASNVWVDHLMGAGLIYDAAHPATVDDMTGVTVTAGLDHAGGVLNGATVAIAALSPGERREVTFHAILIDTDHLTLDVTADWGCGGFDCQAAVTDQATVEILTPLLVDTVVVTSPIDACGDPGVTLTIRNAGQTACYNVQVTETLPPGLPFQSGSTRWRLNSGGWNGPDAAYNPNPTVSPLVWSKNEIPALASLDPGDTMEINHDLAADCAFTGGTLTVSTQYEDPGGEVVPPAVSTFPVVLRAPDLRVTKTRADAPVGCGETIEWTITVENRSGYTLPIVWVEDTLDAAYTYHSSVGDPPYTSDDGTFDGVNEVAWELRNLNHNDSVVLTVRAFTDSAPCSPDLDNTVRAWWGCGAADGSSATKPGQDPPDNSLCLAPAPVTFVRTETRQPALSDLDVGLSPASIDACNQSTTVTFVCANSGATDASNLDVVITLPAGLTYIAGTAEQFIWTDNSGVPNSMPDPTISGNLLIFTDTSNTGNNLVNLLQADGGIDTLVLSFAVQSNCYATADLDYTVFYYDCCGDSQYTTAGSQPITALYPDLAVTQAPATSQVACGAQQAWTITVTNTGTGNAQVVRLEDTPGAWITVDPAASTPGITDLGGGVWGWEFNDLASGAALSFTLVGTLNSAGNDCSAALRQNQARAIWGCGLAGEAIDSNPTTTGYDCTYSLWANAPAATLSMPDLIITAITPGIACLGDGVFSGSMSVTVRNQGSAPTLSGFTVSVTDGSWTGSGTADILSAGASVTVPINTAGWPVDCHSCAAYVLTAVADSLNQVCECNELNNGGASGYAPPFPDLRVNSISPTGTSDGRLQVRVNIGNAGCGASTAGFSVRLVDDQGHSASISVANLDAGSSTNVDFTNWISACAPAAVNFTATVDDTHTNCECDGDNSLGFVFSNTLPNLEAASITPATVCADDGSISGTISVQISNTGNGPVTSDFRIQVNDGQGWTAQPWYAATLGGTLPLAAGSSATVDIPWTRGFTTEPYTCSFPAITVTVDSSNAIVECNNAGNSSASSYSMTIPNLRVMSIIPTCSSDGVYSVAVVVDNNGCGQAENAVVRLSDDDGQTADQTATLAAGESQTLSYSGWPADGNPATLAFTAAADPGALICELSGTDNSASISFPRGNLNLVSITPACISDETYQVSLVIQNNGSAAINTDFVVRVTDNDGHASDQNFTATGGTLPFNSGTQQTVVFSGWTVDCSPATLVFTVVLDPTNLVCESTGGDNTNTGTLTVNDLQAASVVAATSCGSDGSITGTMAVTVANTGGNAVNGDFSILVSDGQGWTSELYYNADLGGTLPLVPGASSTVTFNWTRDFSAAPFVCSFTAIGVSVDSQHAVCECTDSNNSNTASYSLPYPNLNVVSVIPACSGDGSYSVAVLVSNNGCATATNAVVRLGDDDGQTADQTVTLAAGAQQTLTFSPWPVDGSPTTLDLTASVDPAGTICELDGTMHTLTVSHSAPDLRLASLTGQCSGDGQLRVELVIENTGAVAVTTDFAVSLADDDGQGRTTSFTAFGGTLPLGAGASQTLAFVDWPADCSPATLQFTAVADPGNVICESDGTDNTLGPVPITPALPDLTVTDIELGGLSCEAGEVSGAVTVTVSNVGQGSAGAFGVQLSTPAGLAFADQPVAGLAAGGSVTVAFPAAATLADCALCEADFTATADPAQAVCECRGDNNTRTVRPTAADKLYWTDAAAGLIQRAEADGTAVETVLSGLAAPRALTLDGTGLKMYWLEPAGGTIRRANLDGTNPETLLAGVSAPVALAVDPAAGKLYWTGASGIQRADLDGANPEIVVPSVSTATGIAVDSLAGRIYFAHSDGRIRGADVDGANLQDVIAAGLGSPFGLALNVQDGQLVFSDPAAGLIQRVQPDGTGLATVLGGLPATLGCLALNPLADAVYYESQGPDIGRVNLDGTGGAVVVDSLSQTGGVALLKLNTAPAATAMVQAHDYLQGATTVPLDDIVLTDPDFCETVTVVLTLADPALGSLSAASGHGETYDPATGRWSVSGPVLDVNAALADVAFLPVPDNAVTETVTVRLRDLAAAGPADGAIVLGVIPYPVISGHVRHNGAGVAGVAMNGLPGSVATDASGQYSATLPHDWSGTVTPALTGYFFTPASQAYAHVTVDQPDQDYVATVTTTTVLVSVPNPSVFGGQVTLTATVSSAAGPPPGTAHFYDGPVEIGTGALSGGSAVLSTSSLTGGTHVLSAIYSGEAGFEASTSAALDHLVNPAATTTTLSSAPNPSVFGETVTLTAVVGSGAGVPTGTVSFREGAILLGTQPLAGGAAAIVIPSPGGGNHTFTAVYSGSTNYLASNSIPLNHLVMPAATATSLASAPNPSLCGSPVTLTAVVASAVPAPAGSVAFRDGATLLGTSALSGGGTATLVTTALAGGLHTLTATYLGSANHAASASPAVAHQVDRAPTTTTVASSANPSRYGQAVTFTATVAGTGFLPTGKVNFFSDGYSLGPGVVLAGGTASLSTTGLAVGVHEVTARYLPGADPNYLPSEGMLPTGQRVDRADTTTVLTVAPLASRPGQAVTLTAAVAATPPGSGAPTGTVTFLDGPDPIGTGILAGASASFTTASLPVGPHQLVARFGGNGSFNPSSSPAVLQAVKQAASSTSLTAGPNPSRWGQAVTLAATVVMDSPALGTPTGTVTFLDGGTAIGAGTLSDGAATLVLTNLPVGDHFIKASYAGDERCLPSESTVLYQAVWRAQTTTAVMLSQDPVCAGVPVTFTATVAALPPGAGAPAGSVRFQDGGAILGTVPLDGLSSASLTIVAPAGGTLAITAVYLGDSEFIGSTSGELVREPAQPPEVTLQPASATVRSWDSATLTVAYTGMEPVSVQWYQGESGDTSTPVAGATGSVLTTPEADHDARFWARLANACGQADSTAASVTILNTYYLAHVVSDEVWWTTLTAVNWGAEAHPLTLEAFAADGALLESRTLPPLGSWCRWTEDAAEILAAVARSEDVWVRVSSAADLKGLVAFGTRDGQSEANLPFAGPGASRLAFPYVVTGVGGWYTGLTLVNLEEVPAAVTLTALGEDGSSLAVEWISIPAHGKYVRLLEEIFPTVTDATLLRSVRAESDRLLAGFELFGNFELAGLAGLPAVSMDGPIFDGPGFTFNEIPEVGQYYTGITFVNLDQVPAVVDATAFDASGTALGAEFLELSPGSQWTRELPAVFPPDEYAAAAYVRWGALQRVTGFELCLSRAGEFRVDGLTGMLEPSFQLVFPVTPAAEDQIWLRLTNQEDLPAALTVSAYDQAGVLLGSWTAALAANQKLDLDVGAVFAPAAAEVAWVLVEANALVVGDAFVVSADGRRLTIYPGFPAR